MGIRKRNTSLLFLWGAIAPWLLFWRVWMATVKTTNLKFWAYFWNAWFVGWVMALMAMMVTSAPWMATLSWAALYVPLAACALWIDWRLDPA